MSPLAPGSTIGVLGGGQLGRMLSIAAAQLGFDVCIFTDEPDSPAARVSAKTIVASYQDRAAPDLARHVLPDRLQAAFDARRFRVIEQDVIPGKRAHMRDAIAHLASADDADRLDAAHLSLNDLILCRNAT